MREDQVVPSVEEGSIPDKEASQQPAEGLPVEKYACSAGRDADGEREEQDVLSLEEGSISNKEASQHVEGLPVEKLPKKKGCPKGSKNKPREETPSDTI
eukprot:scaffold58645_cov45-Attheya_sp.AAC.1